MQQKVVLRMVVLSSQNKDWIESGYRNKEPFLQSHIWYKIYFRPCCSRSNIQFEPLRCCFMFFVAPVCVRQKNEYIETIILQTKPKRKSLNLWVIAMSSMRLLIWNICTSRQKPLREYAIFGGVWRVVDSMVYVQSLWFLSPAYRRLNMRHQTLGFCMSRLVFFCAGT